MREQTWWVEYRMAVSHTYPCKVDLEGAATRVDVTVMQVLLGMSGTLDGVKRAQGIKESYCFTSTTSYQIHEEQKEKNELIENY